MLKMITLSIFLVGLSSLFGCSTPNNRQIASEIQKTKYSTYDNYFVNDHKFFAISDKENIISVFKCTWFPGSSTLIIETSQGSSKIFASDKTTQERIDFESLEKCHEKINEITQSLKNANSYTRDF